MRAFGSRLGVLAAAALAAATIVGCGASATPAKSAAGASVERASLEPYVLPGSKLVIHVRAGAMRELPLFSAFKAAASKLDAEALAPLARCGLGWDDVAELVLSGDPDKDDLLLVARPDDPDAALACLQEEDAAAGSKPAEAPSDDASGGEIAIVHGDLLIAGTRRRVEEARKGPLARAGAGDVLARLEGNSRSLFRVYIEQPNSSPRAMAFALDGDRGTLEARLAVDLSSTQEADQLADLARLTVDKSRSDLRQAGGARSKEMSVLEGVLAGVEIRRRVGGRVTVAMEARGDADEMRDALGAFAGFAQGTASVFGRKAQAEQARAQLLDIAQRVAAYAEAHRRGATRFPRLPASAPMTPAAVPSGEPTAVSASDWSHPTWRELAFAPEGPIPYSFTVETARGGRTAVVRATGDLDGDGVLSVQEVAVRIDLRGGVSIDPVVTARDVLE